jgi:glycosyltransferase involved in cell wall biosynthesis
MRFVLDNPELVKNIVEENRKFLEDNFSIEACAKKMEALI